MKLSMLEGTLTLQTIGDYDVSIKNELLQLLCALFYIFYGGVSLKTLYIQILIKTSFPIII